MSFYMYMYCTDTLTCSTRNLLDRSDIGIAKIAFTIFLMDDHLCPFGMLLLYSIFFLYYLLYILFMYPLSCMHSQQRCNTRQIHPTHTYLRK